MNETGVALEKVLKRVSTPEKFPKNIEWRPEPVEVTTVEGMGKVVKGVWSRLVYSTLKTGFAILIIDLSFRLLIIIRRNGITSSTEILTARCTYCQKGLHTLPLFLQI